MLKLSVRTASLLGLCAVLAAPAQAQTAIDTANALAATGDTAAAVANGTPAATPAPGAAAAATTPATTTPAADAGAGKVTTITTSNGTKVDIPPPEAPKIGLDEPFRQSLFMTPEDLVAIERALKGVVSATGSGGSGTQEIPQVRKIVLSGVSYKNDKDWVVWINGQKIVPGLLLKEIVDIKVERDLVHLKWFDIGLNGVINITLHPHDTYDIVTGVLLPG